MVKKIRQNFSLFLWGTLISSIGSQVFFISLISYLTKEKYPLLLIGGSVAAIRLTGLASNLLFGDLSDKVSPAKILIATEILGTVLSGVLAIFWHAGRESIFLFILTCCVRSFVLALQQSGRSKIAKLFGDQDNLSHSKLAIWLNKVTHGSIFFAAGLSLLFVKYFTFYHAIAFDCLSFIINGIILTYGRFDSEKPLVKRDDAHIFQKFKFLYQFNFATAAYDLLLAIVLLGGNLFFVRFTGEKEEWIPIFLTSYGLAVWVAGYLERVDWINRMHKTAWLFFGFTFSILALHPAQGFVTFFLFFLNDCAYWILFHRYSGLIQRDTPKEYISSVVSARNIQMLVIVASGELVVGAWKEQVSVFWEGTWRAIVCFITAIILIDLIQKKSKTRNNNFREAQ